LALERCLLEAKAQRLNAVADGPEDERLYNMIYDLEEAIALAPAHTVAGITIKLRLIHENHERGRDRLTCDANSLRTALETLERLGAPQDDAKVRVLHAAWQEAQKATTDASDRAQNAKEKGQPDADALWKLAEKVVEDEIAAYDRFIEAPAGTVPAMLLKLDAWTKHQAEDPNPAAPLAVMRDLQRLAGRRVITSEADPVLALCEKHRKAWTLVDGNDPLGGDAFDVVDKIALEIANTTATTIDGVGVKI